VKKILSILSVAAISLSLTLFSFPYSAQADEPEGIQEFSVSWSDADGTVYKDISYGDRKNNLFDIYAPKNVDPAKNHAVMLFIHGGSWIGGNRGELEHAAKRYAKEGYITANMEYSLISKDNPDVDVFLMLDEITACIAKIKELGKNNGYDLNSIAISGYSAGAHLSLLYAYTRAKESPIPIKFVFEQVGPTGFDPMFWDYGKKATMVDFGKLVVWIASLSGEKIGLETLLSGKITKIIKTLSPAYNVTANTVPTICGFAGKDEIVPRAHHDELKSALEKNNIPCVFIEYPNSSHWLAKDPKSSAKYKKAVLEFANKYLK